MLQAPGTGFRLVAAVGVLVGQGQDRSRVCCAAPEADQAV